MNSKTIILVVLAIVGTLSLKAQTVDYALVNCWPEPTPAVYDESDSMIFRMTMYNNGTVQGDSGDVVSIPVTVTGYPSLASSHTLMADFLPGDTLDLEFGPIYFVGIPVATYIVCADIDLAMDVDSVNDDCCYTFTLTGPPAGIDQEFESLGSLIYFGKSLYFDLDENKRHKLEVYNTAGQLVYKDRIRGSGDTYLDLRESGIYIATLSTRDGRRMSLKFYYD